MQCQQFMLQVFDFFSLTCSAVSIEVAGFDLQCVSKSWFNNELKLQQICCVTFSWCNLFFSCVFVFKLFTNWQQCFL